MTQAWSIYVELGHRDAPDDLYDALLDHDRLAGTAPAIGTAPNGNLTVQLFIEASTVRHATDAGLKDVTAAARDLGLKAPVVGIEAMTEQELDRRNAEPAIPALVGVAEIAEMLGVSRPRAKQLTDREDFPPAVARLKAGPVYVKEQVEAFERRWERRGGRPPKPVDLSSAERDLLAALSIARNAIVHGERDAGCLLDLLHAHARALSGPIEDVMRVETLAAEETGMRLHLMAGAGKSMAIVGLMHQLAAKRLLTISPAEQDVSDEVEEVIDVDLTARGERLASV